MKNALAKILLVEDEENFGSILKNYLELSKYEVIWAKNGEQGWSLFKQESYDLCLMDVMLPKKDGFTLTKEIRVVNQQMPIIFLTAKGEKEDQIKGYKTGGDDYLTKPFDTELLLLKIQAVLQRRMLNGQSDIREYRLGEYHFTPAKRRLSYAGENIRLSPKENSLLHLLSRHKNDIMPRQLALIEIWNNDDYFATRSMDVYIAKLRKLLQKDSRLSIENIHGAGYQLNVPLGVDS